MKKIISSVAALILLTGSASAFSADFHINNLQIKQIRAVGDYANSIFSNTIEIWPTTALNWPPESGCTDSRRVYVNSKHSHIISAAYMALASGQKININVDNTLPNRYGACEVSFLDVVN